MAYSRPRKEFQSLGKKEDITQRGKAALKRAREESEQIRENFTRPQRIKLLHAQLKDIEASVEKLHSKMEEVRARLKELEAEQQSRHSSRPLLKRSKDMHANAND
uniref:Uncharacterized protein n=1 Tax=Coccolithus braarudii TaxID=221442 RepID=A0A7S0L6I0_9EUKA